MDPAYKFRGIVQSIRDNFQTLTKEVAVIENNSTYLRQYFKTPDDRKWVMHEMLCVTDNQWTNVDTKLALVYLYNHILENSDDEERAQWVDAGVPYFLFRLGNVFRLVPRVYREKMCKLLSMWQERNWIWADTILQINECWNEGLPPHEVVPMPTLEAALPPPPVDEAPLATSLLESFRRSVSMSTQQFEFTTRYCSLKGQLPVPAAKALAALAKDQLPAVGTFVATERISLPEGESEDALVAALANLPAEQLRELRDAAEALKEGALGETSMWLQSRAVLNQRVAEGKSRLEEIGRLLEELK